MKPLAVSLTGISKSSNTSVSYFLYLSNERCFSLGSLPCSSSELSFWNICTPVYENRQEVQCFLPLKRAGSLSDQYGKYTIFFLDKGWKFAGGHRGNSRPVKVLDYIVIILL